MKKLIATTALALATLTLSGCGEPKDYTPVEARLEAKAECAEGLGEKQSEEYWTCVDLLTWGKLTDNGKRTN